MRRQQRTYRTRMIKLARRVKGFHHYEWRHDNKELFVLSFHKTATGDLAMFLPVNRPMRIYGWNVTQTVTMREADLPSVRVTLCKPFRSQVDP